MILLQLNNAAKLFGETVVFTDISWSIQDGERIGLVGANGCGKSSLLKVISGEWFPDRGTVERSGDVRVGYLPQSARVSGELPLWEEMAGVFAGREDTEPFDYKIRMALAGVGLDEAMWARPTRALSGGEKCRAALARVLLAEPDVLLLDEPTNHLDVKGREWLEAYLARFRGAVVMVAHDRLLLNRATNRTAFMLNTKMRLYKGNYAASREQWDRDVEQQTKLYERQREEILRQEDFIRRNIAGQKTKQAQSRRRMLSKLERLERPDTEKSGPGIGWVHAGRSRADLVRVEDAELGYAGLSLVRAHELVLRRGEKIGMVGPNGCGKSTFLRTLLGEIGPLGGRVELAAGTEISYFRQEVPKDYPELTVREHFWNGVPGWDEGEVRSFLGRFLFSGDEVMKTLGALSGGERRRLELAKLATVPSHLLVLDEPTNHLDIQSQEAVERALKEFEGSFLLVSHDRQLLDEVCDKLWVFEDGRMREFLGNYSDYAAQQQEAAAQAEEKERKGAQSFADSRKRRAERDRLKRQIVESLAKIETLEAEIAAIEREGRNPAMAANWERLNFLTTEKRKKDRELHKWMHTWEEATSRLQELDPDAAAEL